MGSKSMTSQSSGTKKKPQIYTADNPLESLRGVGSSVVKTITKDVLARGTSDVIASILGGPVQSGELKPNQTIEFSLERKTQVAMPLRNIETSPVPKEDAQTKQKIESLRYELKALAESVKSLNQDIQKTILEAPVAPGVYHMNFYDQLRTYIQALRLQIEDSRTWLSAAAGKKKKQGYWGMVKKHGTSFGLSGERSIATSAG